MFKLLFSHKHCISVGVALFLHFFSFAQKPPNVILILSDDQGWGDLSLHGNRWIETPNLDRLAKSGKEFINCYASPLCAPSRASLLTGRHHLSTGVLSVSKGLETMDSEETTLAELFKANGYRTGIFGKWHNGEHYPNRPTDQGFDEFLGFCAGHLSNYFNATLEKNNNEVKTNGYITDVLTNAALEFISQNKNAPFFCYIPFNAPHSPHQLPDRYFDKYKAKGLNNELASIYGMIDNMDENIGRILAYLKNNHLQENTIIIFLSDNGPNGIRYNGILNGTKGSVHEGGIRVPFFISWNKHIPPGQIVETPITLIDIYPTLLNICKLQPIAGRPIAGLNLAPLILHDSASFDQDRPIYTHVNFMEVPTQMYAGGFRKGNYRFVYEKDKPQLYDLQLDPGERNDLSIAKRDLVNQLFNDYKAWFTSAVKDLNYDRSIVVSKRGVVLPAYEATLSPGMKFKEGHGWAHDWLEQWRSTSDSLYWEIDCTDPGKYTLELEYLCKKADVGSSIVCSIGKESKEVVIDKAFHSSPVPSPDRVPRKEAYEMEKWKRLKVGTFNVVKGKQLIKLRPSKVAHKNVAELNSIRLTRAE